MTTKKLTIIFPPGDILTSVVWEKEKDTKIIDLLSRLCQLRGLALDSLKAKSDVGKKLDDTVLQQTIEQSGLMFIELVEKGAKKEKKPKQTDEEVDEDFDDKAPSGIPRGIKEKLVPGSYCDIPLREQLFDHEWDSLQKYKATYADLCKNYSDEFIMACLFGRKLDHERTHQLMQNNLKFRKERGLMTIPKFSELNVDSMKPYLGITCSRTKSGNSILYGTFSALTPGVEPFTIPSMCKWMAWFNFVGSFAEGMDGFRNGVCLIFDMTDLGWKNFDLEYNKLNSTLWQDVFPGRPRKIFVLNAPMIFSAVFKVMKTFMKAKIANRFQIVEAKELTKHIDKEQLAAVHGGSYDITHEKYLATLKAFCEKHEERLSAPGRAN